MIGKDHYFSGIHNGLNVGWQILPGQVFTSPVLHEVSVSGSAVFACGKRRKTLFMVLEKPVGPALPRYESGRPAGGRRAEAA